MLPYARIAATLEEVSGVGGRKEKANIITAFLKELPEHALCPSIRLLVGELWPSWEGRQMNAGPEAVAEALAELAGPAKISVIREEVGEMGAVAERALGSRSQHPLSVEALDAIQVYHGLRKISILSGASSRSRASSILRGLLIEATPLEGKYIARTLTGKMLAGLGPSIMLQAVAEACDQDVQKVRDAYRRMPEPGLVAVAASTGVLKVSIRPMTPVRPMLIPRINGLPRVPGLYQLWYGGLRVQVHKSNEMYSIYSSRSKNIAPSLASLSEDILAIAHDFVMDAELLGFRNGGTLSKVEMVRFINRMHHARRSNVLPRLKATDLLFLDGVDLTPASYGARWEALTGLLPSGETLPFLPLSAAEVVEVKAPDEAKELCSRVLERGFEGLVLRDPLAPYTPGELSRTERSFRGQTCILRAAVMEMDRGPDQLPQRCKLGIRGEEDLIPLGWVHDFEDGGLREILGRPLPLGKAKPEANPLLIVKVRISGVRFGDGYSLIRPRIVGIDLDPSAEVDGADLLKEICGR